MDGQHAYIVITDAYVKGLSDFNITAAYELMKKCATTPCANAGRDVNDWIQYGYIPYESDTRGSCSTQALSYDDYALATLAGMLNNSQDMILFLNRSKNYKNVSILQFVFHLALFGS